ncbi:hypothetical protein [Spirosoma fluviale]|uniref:Uncharacterized protein n=1 Tax=Spirosoma fluviale TaxID=1597977 RepID=A0A286FDV0_9BACT|nr:hypothetical protein [Spirosoma fluviale]SOD81004.1 hypothetical protein SAMN06269250_1642 [Spirosoma fluviale]
MSKQSSSFIGYRQPGDCRPNADIVVYFPGTTADLPLIEASNLVFKGGIANVPNQGIAFNGFGAGDYKIDFDSIKPGGAGVKLRCATTELKQRIRFNVARSSSCGEYMTNVIALELKPVETCAQAYEFDEELPLNLFKRCSTLETDCQVTESLARQFNANYAHLGTAYQVIESVEGANRYAVDIEIKNPGDYFQVEQHEGLSRPRVIIPSNKRTYTRSLVQDWFNTAPNAPLIFSGVDATLNVIELFITIDVNTTMSGIATSDLASDTNTTTKVPVTVTVLFEQNSNGDAAFAKLKALLKGPGSGNGAAPYISRMIDDTCADNVLFPYTLVRADSGDGAAFAAIKADYPDIKTAFMVGYIGGKSYYEIYTGSDGLPVPSSAKPNDVLTKGGNQVPAPYTVSACPAGTACGDCPPSPGAPI